MKTAIITGVLGQDGTFLSEHLLKLNHKVYGIARRKSTDADSWGQLEHLRDNPNFKIIFGDITDSVFISNIISDIKPTKFFNLGAQSHVGYSFSNPYATFETNASSVVQMLSAIQKFSPRTRFYQASTSELFGGINCPHSGYNEASPFHPRSPYGVSKLAAHWSTINFREAYKIHACAGILFNHECLTAETPVIIKKNNIIDILPIEEIVPHREDPSKGKKYSTISNGDIEVWDGGRWSEIKTLTATWNEKKNDKKIFRVLSRGGFYEATADHVSFLDGENEIKTSDIKPGDKLQLKKMPELQEKTIITKEEAELLGLLCSDGSISKKPYCKAKFINKDIVLINKVKYLWETVTGGHTSIYENESGYKKENKIFNLNLNGNSDYLKMLRDELYTEKGKCRIPKRVLNSNKDVALAFLRGFNLGDGTKSSNQKTEFSCFTTDSQTLASGLWFLVESTLGLRMTLCNEERGDKIYYKININSNLESNKGKHLIRDTREVNKIKQIEYTGWVFDLETNSGTFSAGIGNTWVHNSPRRGLDFITRKITNGVAKIKAKKSDKITVGNIDAYRDWGYAGDYVEMMNLMLESDDPREYVIATGQAFTVKELIRISFDMVGIKDWQNYIEFDERFMRPSEVPYLLGDPTKARNELHWVPKTNFAELIEIMILNDLKIHSAI